uniref:Uncharacterized protein n=1 Tax=Rhizophora mucronata TaxID=61149 RepID=A0A2P2IK07_RHIMU
MHPLGTKKWKNHFTHSKIWLILLKLKKNYVRIQVGCDFTIGTGKLSCWILVLQVPRHIWNFSNKLSIVEVQNQ